MSRIRLSDNFNYGRLIRFVLPSIGMMMFTSVYGIVDGFFLSNYAGTTSFAAVNIVMPYMYLISAIGFMVGAGGSALVAILLGKGKKEEARQTFTMLIALLTVSAVVISVLSAVFMPQLASLLGAKDGQLFTDAVLYGRISMISMPCFMLQNAFQSFMVTAERPKLGLVFTITAGVINIVLDYVLVGMMSYGMVGAAEATVASEIVGGLMPMIYFACKNSSLLAFVPARVNWSYVGKTCYNGLSELMQSIAGSVVSIGYNLQLLRLIGENGVAAYGVIMYVNFIFIAVFYGYDTGSAPLFSYHYAADNHKQLHNLYDKTLKICAVLGMALAGLAFVMAPVLARIFVSYDEELLTLTVHGMRITAASFLVLGYNTFGSGFFTALGNGFVSAMLSFMKTIVFQLAALFALPLLIGVDGVWWAGPASAALTLVLTIYCLLKYKNRYNY